MTKHYFYGRLYYVATVDGDPRYVGWKGKFKAANEADARTLVKTKAAKEARKRVQDLIDDGDLEMTNEVLQAQTFDQCIDLLNADNPNRVFFEEDEFEIIQL